jgi:hypothetical protein
LSKQHNWNSAFTSRRQVWLECGQNQQCAVLQHVPNVVRAAIRARMLALCIQTTSLGFARSAKRPA